MVELKIPRPGESINEVVVSKWFVANGDFVEKDQEVGEIESDKATLPLIAPASGRINISIQEGTNAQVGDIACTIDTSVKGTAKEIKEVKEVKETKQDQPQEKKTVETKNLTEEKKVKTSKPIEKPEEVSYENVKITPVARSIMEEHGLSVEDIIKGLQRLGKEEVHAVLKGAKENNGHKVIKPISKTEAIREVKREQMSQFRKKLSARLVAVKNETAMLTTFNEADMSEIMSLRNKYQKEFTEKYGIKLGFMSFFTKAVTIALQQHPRINSMIEGDDIVTPKYCDIGIAVQTDKGLLVPVLRNTESMNLAEIEENLATLAEKARAGKLSIEEMTGGTFTITNGGVFGSLLSTPILNPPQSAILGMHNIVERPVAINKKVEIRPMMYLALSYDHRIVDGKDSVSFLVKIKELVESPYKMLLNGKSTEKLLLDL
jgi:2-oxoglutarate dehydrogenase E2 component (dihydrolipoamide succinyltransferase)